MEGVSPAEVSRLPAGRGAVPSGPVMAHARGFEVLQDVS